MPLDHHTSNVNKGFMFVGIKPYIKALYICKSPVSLASVSNSARILVFIVLLNELLTGDNLGISGVTVILTGLNIKQNLTRQSFNALFIILTLLSTNLLVRMNRN